MEEDITENHLTFIFAMTYLRCFRDRFINDEDYVIYREALDRFRGHCDLPHQTEYPIDRVTQSYGMLGPDPEMAETLHNEGYESDMCLFFDADWNCRIAFSELEELIHFKLKHL